MRNIKRTAIATNVLLALTALQSGYVVAAEEKALGQVVISATKTEKDIKQVSSAVTVITQEDIERSSAVTVDQVIQGVAGVYAARMDPSSPNRIAQTYSRGFPGNSRTLVLVDGIPMNVLYDGQVDWSQLSTRDVERVEVVRGAGSALFGGSAMGGVINVISKAPPAGVNTEVTAEYGSMNSQRLNLAHSRNTGPTSFSISAGRFESDGYNMWRPDSTVPAIRRDKIGTIKDNFSAKVIHELSSSSMLEGGLSYMRDEATHFYKNTATGYTPQTREQFVPTIRYVNSEGDQTTSIAAYARIGKQWADTLNATYTGISEKGDYEDQTFGLTAQHTRRFGEAHLVSIGGEHVEGKVNNHFTYPGTNRLRHTVGDVTRSGVYLQDEIQITPRWSANLAGRFDQWKTGGNQMDTGTGAWPSSTYKSRSSSGFSPKAGTVFAVTEALNARASIGSAFNLPTMDNLYATSKRGTTTYWGNPDLDPERVKSYDVGVDYYFGKKGYVKATAYYNDAKDFIYSVQRDATNVDKINVGGVVTKGVEFEGKYQVTDRFGVMASYTINNSEITDNPKTPSLVGKQLTNVPRKQGMVRADWRLASGTQLFATANYVGERFGNDTNTTIYNQYVTYDLGVTHPITKDLSVRLLVNNVLDQKYEGVGYIAPGTVVTAGVNMKF